MKTDYRKLAAAVFVCLSAGFIGSFFTVGAIPTWYATIQKPAFNPPSWVFGPVWTTLYVLMGISAYLIWMKGWDKKEVRIALFMFSLQLFLNVLWSVLFFGINRIFYAFIEIVFLWAAILATILLFNRISRNAALLLIPYILWVSFAAFLNYSLWQLNI